MILVDTGFLIALVDKKDVLHQRAKDWFMATNGPFLVTEHVLAELVNHFSSSQARLRTHLLLELLFADKRYRIIFSTPDLFHAGLTLHRARPDKAWSLTDCISFHLMRERGIQQALAYDHHFEQAGFDPLLRRDPSP